MPNRAAAHGSGWQVNSWDVDVVAHMAQWASTLSDWNHNVPRCDSPFGQSLGFPRDSVRTYPLRAKDSFIVSEGTTAAGWSRQ